ncbi:MAG: 5-oxoprolinase subunit PxpB [Maribacter sp.]|uniref:5-oxoprolinase subunit PxpB n=1 Tax=Maribacter sp. TaxID=1897614 RepID=UPI0032985DDA
MSDFSISIRPFGVHAILVEWPNKVDEAILNDILKFANYLESNCLDVAKWEIVAAYNSVTLILRQEPIDFDRLKNRLKQWHAECGDSKPKQKYLWRLPVCYDLEFGIDLEEVAKKLALKVPELIQQHTENVYTVYGIGFLPGFMYLGGLPKSLEIARKATPRLKVQKGAVGLAGKQTGIYPQESPGGWNIIGNCSVPMFNAKDENPCFVNVGDKVQFYAIERAEYDLHKIEGEVGIYKLEKTEWNA